MPGTGVCTGFSTLCGDVHSTPLTCGNGGIAPRGTVTVHPLFPHLWITMCTSCAVNSRCPGRPHPRHLRAARGVEFRWARFAPAGGWKTLSRNCPPKRGSVHPEGWTTSIVHRGCPQAWISDTVVAIPVKPTREQCLPRSEAQSRGKMRASARCARRSVRAAHRFLHRCGQALSTGCAWEMNPGRDDVSSPLHKTGSTGYLRAVVARWDERHGERHALRGKNVSSSCPRPP